MDNTDKAVTLAIAYLISEAERFESMRDAERFESHKYWAYHDGAMNIFSAAESLMPGQVNSVGMHSFWCGYTSKVR